MFFVFIFSYYAWMKRAPSDTVRKRRGAGACAVFALVGALSCWLALVFEPKLEGSPLRVRFVVALWAFLVIAIVAGGVYLRLRRRDETSDARV